MTAPTVEAAIHELMDLAWNLVYDLLSERGLLGDGLDVEEYTGIHSWVDGLTRYTVVHSRRWRSCSPDTRPVDAIPFHHDLLGADDPKVDGGLGSSSDPGGWDQGPPPPTRSQHRPSSLEEGWGSLRRCCRARGAAQFCPKVAHPFPEVADKY
jgi:hypothetical protein